MSEPYIGQIIPVGFNFAPPGWLPCNGQLLPISEYDSLFNLIGTTYGGDGQTNFALPNLSGAVAVGSGVGSNLQPYALGQAAGSEFVTLNATQLGNHSHPMGVSTGSGTNTPGPTVVMAANSQSTELTFENQTAAVAMAAGSINAQPGQNLAHENRQPLLAINYIIATAGIYPSPS